MFQLSALAVPPTPPRKGWGGPPPEGILGALVGGRVFLKVFKVFVRFLLVFCQVFDVFKVFVRFSYFT